MREANAKIMGDLTTMEPVVVSPAPADLANVGEKLAVYQVCLAPLYARRVACAWAEVYLR